MESLNKSQKPCSPALGNVSQMQTKGARMYTAQGLCQLAADNWQLAEKRHPVKRVILACLKLSAVSC